MAASIKHAAAAVAARKEGRPIPEAPVAVVLPASGDTDTSLDLQRSAAIELKGQYSNELRAIVEELETTRQQLIQARFDAADFRLTAGLYRFAGFVTTSRSTNRKSDRRTGGARHEIR